MKYGSTEQPILALSDGYRQGRCRRCGGLLVPEFFVELDNRSSETTSGYLKKERVRWSYKQC